VEQEQNQPSSTVRNERLKGGKDSTDVYYPFGCRGADGERSLVVEGVVGACCSHTALVPFGWH